MKKKSRKSVLILKAMFIVMILSAIQTTAVFAGQWEQKGVSWKYHNDNGFYVTGWNWIDGKAYYFDLNGEMLADAITPDGYVVNADGAWVADGVVQIQNISKTDENAADNYDSQYPLKGYMESWFASDPVTGTTSWRSDPSNFVYEANNHMQFAFDLAVKARDPLALNYFGGLDLAAIAKLTGYTTTGLDVDPEKLERLSTEIRNFLNEFDWRNASDYDKAVRIAKRITKADYLSQEGTQYAYSCLVEGVANCDGYTDAAYLLAACVGLPANGLGFVSHIHPVFLVDDVWLSYEPTNKSDSFTIAEVYAPCYYLGGEPQLSELGKFCAATGYEIPKSVEGKFPNISYGVIHGEQAPFIKFK